MSNAINGHAALQFSGAQLLTSNDTAFSHLLYPTGTVFVVQSSVNDTQASSSVWSGASTTARFNLSLPNGSNLYFDDGDANSPRLSASSATYTTTGNHLWMGSGQAAGSELLRRDGTTTASKTAGPQTSFSCSLVVGGRSGCATSGSYYLTGSIGEVIVYDTVLSATN